MKPKVYQCEKYTIYYLDTEKSVKYQEGGNPWVNSIIRHRLDGPAYENSNEAKIWYKEDKLHRQDGPAVEYSSGTKIWYKEDKLHREDGPAIEYSNGSKEWFIEGIEYTEKEYKVEIIKYLKKQKLSSFK